MLSDLIPLSHLGVRYDKFYVFVPAGVSLHLEGIYPVNGEHGNMDL